MGADESLERQIRFVVEADRLTTVARQSRSTDLGRVMAMLVVHDMVEIDAGDLFLYSDSAAQARQQDAERAAADRIFALLPVRQAAAVRALWDEFEERRTPEARFARALDRLQPMLLNMRTGGGTWVAHGVPVDQVLSKVELIEDGSASLGGYARVMIAEAVQRGFLRAVAEPNAGEEDRCEPILPQAPAPGPPARHRPAARAPADTRLAEGGIVQVRPAHPGT